MASDERARGVIRIPHCPHIGAPCVLASRSPIAPRGRSVIPDRTLSLDAELQRWIVEHRVDWLDPVFLALSRIGSVGFVWILLAGVLALAWRHGEPLVLTAVAVFTADLLASALKLLADRPRPYVADPDQDPLTRAVLEVSFPSGHAATAFAGATALVRFLPRRAVPLYLVAVAVAWSRVYVGVHYVSDVVVGAALGAATTLLLLRAVRRLSPRARRAG